MRHDSFLKSRCSGICVLGCGFMARADVIDGYLMDISRPYFVADHAGCGVKSDVFKMVRFLPITSGASGLPSS